MSARTFGAAARGGQARMGAPWPIPRPGAIAMRAWCALHAALRESDKPGPPGMDKKKKRAKPKGLHFT